MRFRALLVVPLAVLATACGSSSSNSNGAASATTRTPPSTTPGLSKRQISGLGLILVNERGRTLYVFSPEKGGKVTCTGSCATTWPPLKASGKPPSIGSTAVHPNLVGTVANPSGGKIITYAGWPLHTYSGDMAAGDANGQGIDGKWYVISLAGRVITSKAGTTSTSSTGGYGSGGY